MRRPWIAAAVALPAAGIAMILLHPGSNGSAGAVQESDDLYAPRTVWEPDPTIVANVSVVVYRDQNRSGTYDVGDPPLAGIAVRLWRPNGTSVVQRSNGNGFANFTKEPRSNNLYR
jgi:hypothetical protein